MIIYKEKHIYKTDKEFTNEQKIGFPYSLCDLQNGNKPFLGDDFIYCLECLENNELNYYKQLGIHINTKHNTTAKQYNLTFLSDKNKSITTCNNCSSVLSKRISKINTKNWEIKEYQDKMSRISKRTWENIDFRERKKKEMKDYWKDEGFRQSKVLYAYLSFKEQWKSQEYRVKMANILKKSMSKKQKNFNFRQKTCKYLHKLSGIRMRSEQELLCADWLTNLNLLWEYEPEIMMEDETSYYCDFYIKSLNLMIEVKRKRDVYNNRVQYKKDQTIKKGYNYIFYTEDDYGKSLTEVIAVNYKRCKNV